MNFCFHYFVYYFLHVCKILQTSVQSPKCNFKKWDRYFRLPNLTFFLLSLRHCILLLIITVVRTYKVLNLAIVQKVELELSITKFKLFCNPLSRKLFEIYVNITNQLTIKMLHMQRHLFEIVRIGLKYAIQE